MIKKWIFANCRFASASLKDMIDANGSLFVIKQMGKSVLVKGLHADKEIADITGVNVGDFVFEVVKGTDGRKLS